MSYHVLLVEEDPKEIERFSILIEEVAGCHVDVYSRAGEAPESIEFSRYHLVIIALRDRPLELLEKIKRLSPSTSVILIARHPTVEEAVAAIRMGAEDYLGQSFAVESFQLSVKRGLDRKEVFSGDRGATDFVLLLNSCQLISASQDQRKILEIVKSYLMRELKAGYSAFYSIKNEKMQKMETTEPEVGNQRALQEVLDMVLSVADPVEEFLSSKKYFEFFERGRLTPGFFLFRFFCGGPDEFVCACLSPKAPSDLEAFEGRLRLLKAQIEVTGKNIEHYSGVQQLAYLDDATGLYNTRYLNTILDRKIAEAAHADESFAVLFIDVDRFKEVNDQYGHRTGTRLLNELGNFLKKDIGERESKDAVFRYGGDEFVAILSSCDSEHAKATAERIRRSVERRKFLKDERNPLHLTVSIGIALFPDHAQTKQDIIEAADRAMYSAKKTVSKNSVYFGNERVVLSLPRTKRG